VRPFISAKADPGRIIKYCQNTNGDFFWGEQGCCGEESDIIKFTVDKGIVSEAPVLSTLEEERVMDGSDELSGCQE